MTLLIDVYDHEGEMSRYKAFDIESAYRTLSFNEGLVDIVSKIVVSSVNPRSGSINKIAVFGPKKINYDVVEKAFASGMVGGASSFGTQCLLDAF